MLSKYHTLVHQDMGDPKGVLMYDESAFVKKGEDSVGVERQYCGTIGKVDNCQVGVFEGYASRHGYALVDKRLFIPESWFGAEHEEKRKKVNLPEGYAFKTKPQLAADMFEAIVQEGILPFPLQSISVIPPPFPKIFANSIKTHTLPNLNSPCRAVPCLIPPCHSHTGFSVY